MEGIAITDHSGYVLSTLAIDYNLTMLLQSSNPFNSFPLFTPSESRHRRCHRIFQPSDLGTRHMEYYNKSSCRIGERNKR